MQGLYNPILEYTQASTHHLRQINSQANEIRVIELFAGVGGFRIGFERASDVFKTVWSNQWEPSTKRQDASDIYIQQFGPDGHSNQDITKVDANDIPDADILCGGFPCQDYSVATTLHNSKGIEGKKGVLWWEIHRILKDKGESAPKYLVLENVDRLLSSPASQRGRDFAIILASLADLGYYVEWRVINAADYGMPQRRKRTYIVAYHKDSLLGQRLMHCVSNPIQKGKSPYNWIVCDGVFGKAFDSKPKYNTESILELSDDLVEITESFNKGEKNTPFCNAGVMIDRVVYTVNVESVYQGPFITLGELLEPEENVPESFFISDEDMKKWVYLKGSKSEKRVTKDGFEYEYKEGGMTFPDALDKPSRTIITGEGGNAPSRFKHVILTQSGKYRRLMPVELERLNMFPDNHTQSASDVKRAFLMGNALVTGIVERIGLVLKNYVI